MKEPLAIDLFSGAGGATQGLIDAGYRVIAAIESEGNAAATYRLNHPEVVLFEQDIRLLRPGIMRRGLHIRKGRLTLLKACPPCQGFSSLNRKAVDDQQNDLVLVTLTFVQEFEPKAVLIENVPGLQRNDRFELLCTKLREMGYDLRSFVVSAADFGVPQRRRRLVVLATRRPLPGFCDVRELIPKVHRREPMTAGEQLSNLYRVLAPSDPWHKWRSSTQAVRARIAEVPINGSRFDLPPTMQLNCHSVSLGVLGTTREATASYGRVKADLAAPTMTTRCTTPACGSFIHPTEHRGLSLREAASLQTFPSSYRWSGGYDSVERQIGNAVPVWMAEALGRVVLSALKLRSSSSRLR